MRTRSIAVALTALALALALAGCAALPAIHQEPAETTSVTVTIAAGHDTNPVDGGRPVVLVAAALGVPTEVFREAFSEVTPAGAGNDVDEDLARSNKAALLAVLSPYGITNDQLDAASNFYRFNGSAGETWAQQEATAVAVVENGVVTSIVITNPGFGYSSTPTVTLSNGQTAVATLAFGTDTATNGSIAAIALS